MAFQECCFPVVVVYWKYVDALKQFVAITQFPLDFPLDAHPLFCHAVLTPLSCHFVVLICMQQVWIPFPQYFG